MDKSITYAGVVSRNNPANDMVPETSNFGNIKCSRIYRGLPNITSNMCYIISAIHPLAFLYKPHIAINQPFHNLIKDIRSCMTTPEYSTVQQEEHASKLVTLMPQLNKSIKPKIQDDATTVIPECLDALKKELETELKTEIEYGPFNVQVQKTFHCPSCESLTTGFESPLTAICFNLNDRRHQALHSINLQRAFDAVVNDNAMRTCECQMCGEKKEWRSYVDSWKSQAPDVHIINK